MKYATTMTMMLIGQDVSKFLCFRLPSVPKKTSVPKFFIEPLKSIGAAFCLLSKFYGNKTARIYNLFFQFYIISVSFLV